MKKLGLVLVIFLGANQIRAQYFDKTYALSLDINKPVSNTTYVDEISVRGFKFGYREMITEKVFGGVDFSNATYDTYKPRRTYTNGTSAISTDLFNYAYSYGLTLSVDYFFNTERKVMPYAGLGVGASYMKYRQFFNAYSNDGDSWGVLIRPQGGVMLKLKEDSSWGFQAGVHYDYSSAKVEDLGLDPFNTIGFQLGIIIFDW